MYQTIHSARHPPKLYLLKNLSQFGLLQAAHGSSSYPRIHVGDTFQQVRQGTLGKFGQLLLGSEAIAQLVGWWRLPLGRLGGGWWSVTGNFTVRLGVDGLGMLWIDSWAWGAWKGGSDMRNSRQTREEVTSNKFHGSNDWHSCGDIFWNSSLTCLITQISDPWENQSIKPLKTGEASQFQFFLFRRSQSNGSFTAGDFFLSGPYHCVMTLQRSVKKHVAQGRQEQYQNWTALLETCLCNGSNKKKMFQEVTWRVTRIYRSVESLPQNIRPCVSMYSICT